jgi:hypothetical protein
MVVINHCHNARRLVVERTNSWHSRFRKLLVTYEKKLESYFAVVVYLDCHIIIYRRITLGQALSQNCCYVNKLKIMGIYLSRLTITISNYVRKLVTFSKRVHCCRLRRWDISIKLPKSQII